MKRSLSIFFVFLSAIVFAQHYSYRQYTIFEGLPQNQVMDLYVDHYGFLWLGTKGGICRFDGKNFVSFKEQNQNDQYVRGIFEINDTLYYYTGESILKNISNGFEEIYNSGEEKIKRVRKINDSDDFIIATKSKVYKYSNTNLTTLFAMSDTCNIADFKYISDSACYLSLYNSLYAYQNGNIEQIIKSNYYVFIDHNKANTAYYFIKDNDNFCIIKFDYSKNIATKIHETTSDLYSFLFTLDGYKYVIETNQDTWAMFDEEINLLDANSIPDVQINDIVEYNNSMFFATENGLYVLNSTAFENYTEKDEMPKYVWSIFETPENDIVFASYAGKIYKIRGNNKLEKVNLKIKGLPEDLPSLFYMDGYCRNNGQWIIPMSHGSFIGNESSQEFISMIYFTPFCVYEDSLRNIIYFGTNNGIYLYNTEKNKIIKNIQTEGHNVLDIEQDKYGQLWFCTNAKIFLYDGDTLSDLESEHVLYNTPFVSCRRDVNGNMWLGNKTGLFIYDYSTITKVYEGAFTFINNYKDTHIVAGNTTGILYVDIEKYMSGSKNSMYFFDRYNGFIGKECGQNGTFVDSKGNVWIPTSESVVKFMPEKLKIDTLPPPVYIYSLSASGKDLHWEEKCTFPINQDSIYHLTWDNNNIIINFHAVDYECPERVKYKYRLQGYNNEWNEINTGEVMFTNLSPGHYTFEVIACDEFGNWTKKPAVIKIHIVPAFWQTVWFLIIIIILSVFIVILFTYLYLNRKRKKEKEKQKVEKMLVSMQMNTVNAQLDPHFVFNAISAIGTEVQLNNNEKAYDYYVKVTRLLRSSLSNKDTIVRSLAEEISVVEDYLELQKLRFEERIDFSIYLAKDINTDILIPKMCIQVFVENAVKHGIENKPEGGEVTIRIKNKDSYLNIEIQDSGIGRKAASKIHTKSTGIGLGAMSNFFNITNQSNKNKASFEIIDLYENNEAKGTLVILKIPVDYKYII